MPRATAFKFVDESSCECNECGLVLARPSDMRRHMRTHGIGMNQAKYQCTWDGCLFEAIQKSNFDTHYRTHLKDKSQACPSCDFKTCDPGSLTRHRKRIHSYVPKPRKARATKIQRDNSSDRSISPSLTWVSSESSESTSLPSPSSNSSFEPTMDFSSLTSTSNVEPSTTTDTDEFYKLFFPDGLPTDFNLFYEPNCMSGLGYSTFDAFGPRPLLPALESTPSLEPFRPLHVSHSPELSFHLAASYKTSPFTTIPDVDSQALHTLTCGVFQDNVGIPIQQPLPNPYDTLIQQMSEMDPSISVTISDHDFRTIFGCEYEHFLAAKAQNSSPNPSCSSGSTGHSTSTSQSPRPFTGSLLAELYAPIDL
ncbi:hypothetical protein J3R30DRAFT_3706847 [Lentinula aciculospora]|uniref:C2H2-type domain-containing protein n=1 Tax=Lentinula aciculospora TaxID=153920 RepID=A0A9W9A6X0_9AGAR|nr:hypothetical protein J3R30DRAFT_3706847 [Lentinula aciculospora]